MPRSEAGRAWHAGAWKDDFIYEFELDCSGVYSLSCSPRILNSVHPPSSKTGASAPQTSSLPLSCALLDSRTHSAHTFIFSTCHTLFFFFFFQRIRTTAVLSSTCHSAWVLGISTKVGRSDSEAMVEWQHKKSGKRHFGCRRFHAYDYVFCATRWKWRSVRGCAE